LAIGLMTYLSVSKQDADIRRNFADFKLTVDAGWIGVWEGTVRPAGKIYKIRIVYFARCFFEGWILDNPYLAVYVVDPPVGALEKRLLPHIYWNKRNPEWPTLCLYDPKQLTWTPELSIAATIIPWTSEWLLFFEYWQITGEFCGPGRHPDRTPITCQTPTEHLDPETRARLARFRNVEFHRIGRKTGTFGSYLSMVAVSKDYSLLPSWPSSSDDTWTDGLSRRASTSSPALQPEASSRLVSEPV
jgi:hypothetical protein